MLQGGKAVPVTPPRPERFTASGVRYEMRDGQAVPITPAQRGFAPGSTDPDVMQYRSLLGDISRKQKEIDTKTVPETADYNQLNIMQQEADRVAAKIRGRTIPPGGAAPGQRVTMPPGTTKAGRIHVRHPNGKTGWIPESQLAEATAAGYTRIP